MAIPNSYSSLSTLAKCARKYYYGYELGLESRDPAVPLRLGNAVHVGLHILHTGGDIDTAVGKAVEEWGDFRVPPASKHAFVTPGFIEAVLRNYAEDRAEFIAGTQAMDFGGFVAEAKAEAEIAQGVVVKGLLDLPTRIGDNYVLIDHKTTGDWLSSYWAEQFEFSHQLRIYIAMLRVLTGLPFDRAYINGIYVGEKADEAWGKKKSPRSALYGPYLFSEAHLQETEEWIRATQALTKYYQTLNVWPQNDTTRGCQGCEFRQVCRATPTIRSGLLLRDYKEKEHGEV